MAFSEPFSKNCIEFYHRQRNILKYFISFYSQMLVLIIRRQRFVCSLSLNEFLDITQSIRVCLGGYKRKSLIEYC